MLHKRNRKVKHNISLDKLLNYDTMNIKFKIANKIKGESSRMKAKKILPVILIVLGLVLVGTIAVTTAFSKPDENIMCEGVFINAVDVSGMTMEEAKEAVDVYIETLQNKTVTVKIDDQTVSAALKELGYSWNEEESLTTAMSLGKDDNFMKRYKATKELEKNGVVVELEVVSDEAKLRSFIETECTKFDVEPENANLSRENGVFVITEQKTGRKLSVEDTLDAVKEYLSAADFSAENEMVIEAVVADAHPEYTTEMVSLCKDLLGTFSTSYASSSASRANNLANGAKLLNGSVVWPGETFSAGQNLNPITAENGYSMASAYENGQVVDSIGGGVCQVSTTLYNAVLLSELEIVERSNHSMIVSYVKPSMDAAIAGTYKDLKFKNNTDAPIYIEAITAGRTITFNIYGHETRDTVNRSIKYEAEVLEVIEPGTEKITEDPTQPPGYRKVTQSAHKGYKARLWKIVYENGVEVSKEQVNYSSYAASPTYVTVGTKKEEKPQEPEETDTTADTTADTGKDNTEGKATDKDKDTNKKEESQKQPDKEVVKKPETEVEQESETKSETEPEDTEDTKDTESEDTGSESETEEDAVG